jgi:uncharacterized protein YdbL (DUF1318 family)
MNRRIFVALALGGALAAGAAIAQAPGAPDIVVQAKAAGLVGEQADGFLGLVTGSAPPDVVAAMQAINAGRADAYRGIAAKTGVTEQAAGEATARQLFAKMAPGAFFKPLGGSWMRK